MKYIPTIGLEIHAELKTKTKMFCSCRNGLEEKNPNVDVCPICLGHPGTLPTINKEAIQAMIKIGLALNGKIAEHSQFDRKSYFYPDLPKGYQISQYEHPIVESGSLNGVQIRRVHLEEDAGRLLHLANSTLVDFNRAGRPLMELVTEPDIKTAEEAVAFAKELQTILRYLNVSDADMEKGQMRIEANISLREIADQRGQNADERGNNFPVIEPVILGTKVEVKNINSFKAVFGAIEYEIERQEKVLESGEKVIQETRGWDDIKKITVSQRLKEESHGYRYFPEPDLPPLDFRELDLEKLKEEIPELPETKRNRFMKEFGFDREQAETLVEDKLTSDYFEEAFSELKTYNLQANSYKLLYNYFTSDLRGLMNETGINIKEIKISPEHLAHLIFLIEEKNLGSRLTKDILRKMFNTGLDPEEIINQENLVMVSGGDELKAIIQEIIAENPNAVADFKKGKEMSIQFLIGKAMVKLKGRGDPSVLSELILKNLEN